MTRHKTQQQKPPLDENACRNWSPDDAGWQDARLVVELRRLEIQQERPACTAVTRTGAEPTPDLQAVSVKQ